MDRFRAFCFGVGGRVCRKLPPRRAETANAVNGMAVNVRECLELVLHMM